MIHRFACRCKLGCERLQAAGETKLGEEELECSRVRSIDTRGGVNFADAGVAQLVERQLPKLKVVGSRPIARS